MSCYVTVEIIKLKMAKLRKTIKFKSIHTARDSNCVELYRNG